MIFGGGDVEDWAKPTTEKETVSNSKDKTSDVTPIFSLSGKETILSEDISQTKM